MDVFQSLIARWREDSATLHLYGDERGAHVCQLHAEQVEAAVRKWREEVLTLRQAAEESGYSEDRLGKLISKGEIPNAGRKHAPRLRRADLPLKPARVHKRDANPTDESYTVDGLFRDIVTSKHGER